MTNDRIVTAARVDEDAQYEAGLRPRRLDEYIGQDRIRENLQVAIAAATHRGEPLDHVLLHGPPGLGKTTLAYVIANELGVQVRATSGPAIEKPGDLVGIVTNLAAREVLFIDEIHRMSPAVEEILYPALEDYEVDIIIGQGPSARTVKMRLERFTLIGATTRTGLLTSPLRSRFGISHRLEFYTAVDLEEIVRRSARILAVPIETAAAAEIARRARRREKGLTTLVVRRTPRAGGRPTTITSLATYVPPRLLTNADLEKMVDTDDEWILRRVGIRERHIADPGVGSSDLAKEAAMRALGKAGITADEVGVIVVGTVTPDMMFPSTACLLQNKIGAHHAWGFDLNAACSAFTYALTTGSQLVDTGAHDHALVVGADVMSSIIDYTDRATCVLFGDGAGAVVVSAAADGAKNGAILRFQHAIDGPGGAPPCLAAGGSPPTASPATARARVDYLKKDGTAAVALSA